MDVTRGRDATHGVAHMRQVTETALLVDAINREEGVAPAMTSIHQRLRIVVVAMLHDVEDHKYVPPGTNQDKATTTTVRAFLAELEKSLGQECLDSELVLKAIAAVSFSSEKKKGPRWFQSELPCDWLYVRDVVSDADKLQAIGSEGLARCWQYARHAHAGECIDDQSTLRHVQRHAEEKLLRLKDDFIVTVGGKFLARTSHVQMEQELSKWHKSGPPLSLRIPAAAPVDLQA